MEKYIGCSVKGKGQFVIYRCSSVILCLQPFSMWHLSCQKAKVFKKDPMFFVKIYIWFNATVQGCGCRDTVNSGVFIMWGLQVCTGGMVAKWMIFKLLSWFYLKSFSILGYIHQSSVSCPAVPTAEGRAVWQHHVWTQVITHFWLLVMMFCNQSKFPEHLLLNKWLIHKPGSVLKLNWLTGITG